MCDSTDAPATGEPSASAGAGAGATGPLDSDPSQQQLPPKPKRQLPQALRDRFSCRTCHMLCIGYHRLESHFLKYPDHERPGRHDAGAGSLVVRRFSVNISRFLASVQNGIC